MKKLKRMDVVSETETDIKQAQVDNIPKSAFFEVEAKEDFEEEQEKKKDLMDIIDNSGGGGGEDSQ